jgi:hypothetical protein
MFERYTEKARRVIFFARFEASQYGSPRIQSEHILIGLLREHKGLILLLPHADAESIRKQIEAATPTRPSVPVTAAMPLSDESRRVLQHATEEAERLNHRHVGTEHILLGLLREENCFAAKLLVERGAVLGQLRARLVRRADQPFETKERGRLLASRPRESVNLEIHGVRHYADYIRDVVGMIRTYHWHWHKKAWKARDLVVHRKTGKFSLEIGLAVDAEKFMVVERGWKKDYCFICRWELFESDDEHGVGYTNGRNWLCMECCERFIERDFFSSSYSDIT